jgi:hypothetical protein
MSATNNVTTFSNSEPVVPVSTKPRPHHTEQDFLDTDKPIPGQNYACISFLSPEKTLASKELWAFYHYHQYVIKEYNKIFSELTGKIMEKEEDDINMADVVDLRKRMKRVFDMNEVDYSKWKELVEDWKFKELDGVNKAFDEQNNFQTSIRGVKIRGVYNTYEEANVRSKVLQRLDSQFDVFVGQVGYWLAWHPDSNKIENCEYLNEDLNTLMKEYKANEQKRDMFYQEQTRQRTQEAREQTERMKKQLEEEKAKQAQVADAQTETGLVANENTPEVSAESLADSLSGMDPWMQRKLGSTSS